MSGAPTANQFFPSLVMGYRGAKAVLVAHELGLFAALADGKGARTTAALATELGCDPRALDLLARAVAALGLLDSDGERFENSPLAADHLVPGRPGYVGDNLRFQEMLWGCWSSLAEVVRGGKPVHTLDELLAGQEPSFTRDYIRGMRAVSGAAAREVMRLLGDRPMARLLDVGGGPATFSLAFLERNLDATATLLDLPPTLAIARDLLQGNPLAARLELVAGDYIADRTLGEPAAHDLVLLSHVTHDEPDDVNRALVDKVRDALRPGGRVAIHDFVVDDAGCGPPWAALFSLNVLLYTRGGRVYSTAEYLAQLAAAGFVNPVVHPILPNQTANPTTLVVAEKAR